MSEQADEFLCGREREGETREGTLRRQTKFVVTDSGGMDKTD